MAGLDDVVDAISSQKISLESLLDVLIEMRDIQKAQLKNQASGGGSGGAIAFGEKPSTDTSTSGATASLGALSTSTPGTSNIGTGGKLLGRAAEFSAGVAAEVSNPFTSNAETAISAGGGLLEAGGTALGTALGGALGGRLGGAAGQAAGNALLKEGQFVIQSTKRDLLGTLSSLANQGIVPTREQAVELRDSFRAGAEREKEALKLGADVLDTKFAANVLTGGGSGSAEVQKALDEIAKNTRKKQGNGNPSAGLTED